MLQTTPDTDSMYKMVLDQSSNSIRTDQGTQLITNLGLGISQSQQADQALIPGSDQGSTSLNPDPSSNKCMLLDISTNALPATAAVVQLGDLCGNAFLAISRIKLCWMAPAHSRTVASLPAHMQFLLYEVAAGGPYALLLPLLPQGWKATLQPDRHSSIPNRVCIHLDSGNPDVRGSSWKGGLLLAAGSDPYALMDTAVAAAAACAGGARPRWQKPIPDICRYLGWCTWDAFYHDVSARGVREGLWSFKDAGVQPRWIIIDDGWQRTGLKADHTRQQQQQVYTKPQSAQQTPIAADPTSGSCHWILQSVRNVFTHIERRILATVSAIADRLNWWSLLLRGLRSPLVAGPLKTALKAYNAVASEHSKRLLSNEFNAKFSTPTIAAAAADTSSTAAADDVAAVIADLKQEFNLKQVFAWHAILGYWSGVHPTATTSTSAPAAAAGDTPSSLTPSAAAARVAPSATGGDNGKQRNGASSSSSGVSSSIVYPRVSTAMSELEPPTNWSQLVLAGIGVPTNPHRFFTSLHSYLASIGVTGVKVDVQNQLELIGTAAAAAASSDAAAAGGAAAAAEWHAALEDSVAQHFPGNNMINCMCHNTSNLYRMRSSAVARVSDDFYPRLPASHTAHVSTCAFNSCFMGALVVPDWDMFHSKHTRALLHATARMVSGGPIYVSDKPAHHDPSLLARLALPGGLLLPPLLPGRPTRDCLFCDPCCDGRSLLKVWNRNQLGGVVAVFNLQGSSWDRSHLRFVIHDHSPPTLAITVKPADVEGLANAIPTSTSSSNETDLAMAASDHSPLADLGVDPRFHSQGYALYSDHSRSVTIVQGLDQGFPVRLGPAGSDVITVAPLLTVDSVDHGSSNSDQSVSVAVIGLVNMLNPGGAVKGLRIGCSRSRGAVNSSSNSSQPARESSSSDNSSSGSWVVADKEAAPTQPAAAAAAEVSLQILGCGNLLLCCSRQPSAVSLDGSDVTYRVEGPCKWFGTASSPVSSSNAVDQFSRVVVDIPQPVSEVSGTEATQLTHELSVRF